MKREEILQRLGYIVPEIKKKRVIVHSDIAAEADDQYAIVHHLLTPSENVVGIIAANFEWRFRTFPRLASQRYTSMEKSYEEGRKVLESMGIDDVPLIKGAVHEIKGLENLPESPGADFIIKEAMKEDDTPLFIALQAGITDLAIAYLKEPRIADRLTAVWIGGSKYPQGGSESNMRQDILASQIIFSSNIPLWQIPSNVYSGIHITFAELMLKVKPHGELGKYLVEEMFAVNDFYGSIPQRLDFPHGETWSIGDQPTVSVLLQNPGHECWHTEKVSLNEDMTYKQNPEGREIRVYDDIDRRMTLEDFFMKLQLCYGKLK
jgi:inosine-uridine nucleoside N-ribohydrolase